ncbi:MAG: peptidylprolyl isomerase [Solirubrobacterales bacterium]|nr:peptidylprolyl isomerase [Solirubrobacterales bacterium]
MHRPATILALLLSAVAIAACGKDDETPAAGDGAGATATTAAGTATTRTTASGCEAVEPAAPKGEQDRSAPSRALDDDKAYTALLDTSCGKIRIRLDVDDSPKTSSSFAALARDGFYDGLIFHRIAKPGGSDFVVQGGDPAGTGNGGPGYSVVEAPPKDTRYDEGVVAMAKSEIEDPGTSGSQFFIVTADKTDLPPDYAVLGRVVGSRKAVGRIAAAATDPQTEMPIEPVVIEKVTITERG